MAADVTRRVNRRRVFYIPGYDPIPPRRYRELYRREGAAQAALSGYDLTLGPGTAPGFGWRVWSSQDGQSTEAEITVLPWSDIVRASMGQSIAATYGQLIRTAWIYATSGALMRLMRLRKGPVIAALYPVAMLLAQAGLALTAGLAAGALVIRLWPGAGPIAGPAGLALGLATALAISLALLRWFRSLDGRLMAYYLMHDYAFTARDRGATPPALHARLDQFATEIDAALHGPWDEVLVVGHSSGAHLAVSVLARLIRENRLPPSALPKYPGGAGAEPPPVLSFLSLGQVVPMVSFLPRAQALRADLRLLSASPVLTWIDVTAPGDGCAFALCDPVAVTGVAPADKRWPLVISAAFSQTLSPARWKALRWRFFRLHFQYLCAFDNLPATPGAYDYFRITAGPTTLAARFAGRAPSHSRIETPVNRYRDTA
ncbi:hypothetical protein [Phaeovulum sp. NW3]|uniref:hypothetical protein n=1 Tax=Phaeovulum sp. NW3 TaxID=2934933 RepID=UPI0020215576|nr:hypothetical protein [Phaeovulum sp. NW3]MCL7463893.1 hypothetical protein [Phaeovulum sp. NW3]